MKFLKRIDVYQTFYRFNIDEDLQPRLEEFLRYFKKTFEGFYTNVNYNFIVEDLEGEEPLIYGVGFKDEEERIDVLGECELSVVVEFDNYFGLTED